MRQSRQCNRKQAKRNHKMASVQVNQMDKRRPPPPLLHTHFSGMKSSPRPQTQRIKQLAPRLCYSDLYCGV